MKQTAVDWLHHKILNPTSHELLEDINLWFLKAKEMEKEQIEDAYESGVWDVGCRNADSKKYYKENYGQK
jgi:hypothetical protein